MQFDAGEAGREAFAKTFDVCVIGTGPAGITLARRLASYGLDVALMEGGGLEFTPESQDCYVGENIGLDYFPPDIPRLRYFGGTSNHWGGRCRPLDATDFLARPDNPLSGWPIGRAELDPYLAEAADIIELRPPEDFADRPLVQDKNRFRKIVWHLSRPVTRFGKKYCAEITDSERIHLCLNANLVDLTLDADLDTVVAAHFRSYAAGDPGFTVRAARYVLCLGGLENPRFLLNCTSQLPQGIGNGHDLVGRYFCEHPHLFVGDIEFEEPHLKDESFAPTPEFMAEQGVLNFALFSVPLIEPDLSLPHEVVRSLKCMTPFTRRLAERLGIGMSCRWGGVAEYVERLIYEEGLTGRMRLVTEQSLVRDSRVRLGEERDAFGHRRLELDWRMGEIEAATVKAATFAMAEHLAEQRIGRLKIYDWVLAEPLVFPGVLDNMGGVGGQHHMCTTRMADDPRQGVVDRNCQVHGIINLFIGGSSVFATPGHANPTHTIVQLALRLGDHIGAGMHT